jgi:phosphoglycerate dehydrogenase-like enzyme
MCLPGTPETVGFLDEERLSRLPGTAYVINVGRGTTVDQDALIDALNEGRLAGAALDVVFPEPLPKDHPLWNAKNCIITPHISWVSKASRGRLLNTAAENLKQFIAGNTVNQVNK